MQHVAGYTSQLLMPVEVVRMPVEFKFTIASGARPLPNLHIPYYLFRTCEAFASSESHFRKSNTFRTLYFEVCLSCPLMAAELGRTPVPLEAKFTPSLSSFRVCSRLAGCFLSAWTAILPSGVFTCALWALKMGQLVISLFQLRSSSLHEGISLWVVYTMGDGMLSVLAWHGV